MLFAKEWLPVSFGSLFVSIMQAVLLPIVLGVIVKLFFKKQVGQAVHALPLVSVIGIVAIVSSVVSVNREHLLQSGLLIVSVVILHNGIGYLLGFLTAKLFKMDYASQKAIAIEVGMQNSGLGAALATAHFSLCQPCRAQFSAYGTICRGLFLPPTGLRKREKQRRRRNGKDSVFITEQG